MAIETYKFHEFIYDTTRVDNVTVRMKNNNQPMIDFGKVIISGPYYQAFKLDYHLFHGVFSSFELY